MSEGGSGEVPLLKGKLQREELLQLLLVLLVLFCGIDTLGVDSRGLGERLRPLLGEGIGKSILNGKCKDNVLGD